MNQIALKMTWDLQASGTPVLTFKKFILFLYKQQYVWIFT